MRKKVKYKFVKEGGRFYAYVRELPFGRWQPLTYKPHGPQLSFKNFKELFNGFLKDKDHWFDKITIIL